MYNQLLKTWLKKNNNNNKTGIFFSNTTNVISDNFMDTRTIFIIQNVNINAKVEILLSS